MLGTTDYHASRRCLESLNAKDASLQEMEEDVERRINEELERLRTLDEGQRKVAPPPPFPARAPH